MGLVPNPLPKSQQGYLQGSDYGHFRRKILKLVNVPSQPAVNVVELEHNVVLQGSVEVALDDSISAERNVDIEDGIALNESDETLVADSFGDVASPSDGLETVTPIIDDGVLKDV